MHRESFMRKKLELAPSRPYLLKFRFRSATCTGGCCLVKVVNGTGHHDFERRLGYRNVQEIEGRLADHRLNLLAGRHSWIS